jgi:hypothetical protein
VNSGIVNLGRVGIVIVAMMGPFGRSSAGGQRSYA